MWKEALKNSSVILAGVLASRAFMFFYNMFIIRQLSIVEYALYSFFLAVLSWVLVFSHLDLYSAISKYVSEFRALGRLDLIRSYYFNAVIMVAVFSSLGFVVGVALCSSQKYSLYSISIFMASLVPLSIITINDGIMKGYERFQYSAFLDVLGGASKFVVIFVPLIFLRQLALDQIFWLFLLASFISLLLSFLFIWKLICSIKQHHVILKQEIVIKLFNFSKWVCFTDLMNAGIVLTGNFIISFYSVSDLARFNVIMLIYSIFQLGFGAITNALIPQVSRRVANLEHVRLLGVRELGVLVLFGLGMIACLLILPYRERMLMLLFGKPEYTDVLDYVAVLLLAFPFRIITMANKGVLQGLGNPKAAALTSLGTFVINGLLFFILYHHFGLYGAVIAMTGSFLFEFISMNFAANRVIRTAYT